MKKTIFRAVSLLVCLSLILGLNPRPPSVVLAANTSEDGSAQGVSAEVESASSPFPHLSSSPPTSQIMTGTVPTSLSAPITSTNPTGDHVTDLPLVPSGSISSTAPIAPADATVWIENIWVSSNNLYVRLNGTSNVYRLYVRKHGETFGDAPHYEYYQIYNTGMPKNL